MRKSLLFIGAIAFAGAMNAQTVPNSGMENWETITGINSYAEPLEWNSPNQCTVVLGIQTASESSDAHSGSSSAKLETKALSASVKINGMITTSQMICDALNPGQTGGYAETLRPDSLISWVKYSPVNSDNGYIQIIFFGNGGATDTISYNKYNIDGTLSEWTRIAVGINWWSSADPVNVSILFNSSRGNGNIGEAEVGSIMFVDDVEWDAPFPIGVSELEASSWSVYPNPVVDVLRVLNTSGGAAKLEVIDITGRTVIDKKITEQESKLSVDLLTAGVYIYQLRTLKGEVIKTGKLLINP